MPAKILIAVLAVALCLLCAGCVHFGTNAERDATFAPSMGAKIGQDSLEKYLSHRSALLLDTDAQINTTMLDTNTLELSATNGIPGLGMAVAIDKRGYFLTAAHCVEKRRHVWIIFRVTDRVQVKEARIVWRGDDGMPDLAVLCSSSPIEQVFEWATEFTNGIPVYGVGFNFNQKSTELDFGCMAGKMLNISEEWVYSGPRYTTIAHDSPLRGGDSGGPLALLDGRLLGINVNMHKIRLRRFFCEAHRPNREWLQGIIDRDAALRATMSPGTSLQSTAAGPGVSNR